MADNITVTVNDRVVEVPPGTLIIEAARKAGVTIPTFCYDDRLKSVGACRMCLVEVEKMPKLIASCATPVAPNMVIHTESEKVRVARKGVLEFQLINHPLDCPTCDKGGECPLQDNTYTYGPSQSAYKEDKIRFINKEVDQKFDDIPLGPEIYYNGNRCIMCFKCTRIVRELAGEADLGIFDRGAGAYIGIMKEVQFADEYSGNTVEYCPVGALTSRSFRYKIRDWLLKKSPSVCGLCSVGCNINVEWSRDKIYRHMARRNNEVDVGWLCDRGRYGYDITSNEGRILRTHIKRGAGPEPCSWEEATAFVAKYLKDCIDENRGAEIAAIGSPSLSNEEAYAIRAFFKDAIKTDYIDFQTEFSRPLSPDLINYTGLVGTIADLERKGIYIFVGCDPAVEFPVASLRIRSAISKRGAEAVFIGSYDKRLGHFPATNIRVPGYTEAFAVNYLASRYLGEDYRLPDNISFESKKLDQLSEKIRNSDNVHMIAGDGFFNHPDRDALQSSLLKFKKTCGCSMSIIAPQSNFMGVSRFGLYGRPGHSFIEIMEKIDAGVIRALFIFGSNPIEDFPDRKYIHDTLKKLDFLMVVSPFLNSLTNLASIVFPQAFWSEYGGTFVNMEGRIQSFEAGPELPYFGVRPAWSILGEFSDLLDLETVWRHELQVRGDLAKDLPQYSGILNIPAAGLIMESFRKEDLKSEEKSAELPVKSPADYPYLLHRAYSVHHTGWITQKSSNLMNISGRQIAWMNSDDARSGGFSEGQVVRIGTEDTGINIPLHISDRINKGEILIVNSFENNPVNRLLRRDGKATFVSVRKT
jgi:NADH-quinone oxidoreductase subunit G